ncbi:DUF3775 domain-containing protein [Alkalilimnicola ehrlichii MLHE-1]|nr:DUF3775 domain-containing protein [Alkalilimnicola ehrlichii]
MLNVNPDLVCNLIQRIREFQAQEDVVIPDDGPTSYSEDWAMQVLAGHADDLTYQECVETIADLEPDQQMELVALMWLGRGDFEADDWSGARAAAQQGWTPRTGEYLLSTPLAPDYLEEGLEALGYDCHQ